MLDRGFPRWICPAVDTHQVSDNPEYFDVGLLQEKTLGDEDTFRSLANQTQLCGRSRDQRFQALTHGERSLKILINNYGRQCKSERISVVWLSIIHCTCSNFRGLTINEARWSSLLFSISLPPPRTMTI